MKAILVLEDGFCLEGVSFTGAIDSAACGELVFYTGMAGYQEALTNPAFAGQIICMTYPQIGNCGVNAADMQSGVVYAKALLVKECCKEPSNWQCEQSLPDFLKEQGVAGVEAMDTRALMTHLREKGLLRGVLSTDIAEDGSFDVAALTARAQALPKLSEQNFVAELAKKEADRLQAFRAWSGNGTRLAVYDLGVSKNILQELQGKAFDTLVVPASATADDIAATGAAGVFVSDGAGNPALLTHELDVVRELIARDIPVFGAGLGHFVVAMACGCACKELPLGHHGCNYPVLHAGNGRSFITTQHSNYVVECPKDAPVRVSYVHLHDNTVAGIEHTAKPVASLECSPIDAFYQTMHELLPAVK